MNIIGKQLDGWNKSTPQSENMRNTTKSLVILVITLFSFIFNSQVSGQKRLTQTQIDSIIEKRWDFYEIRREYPNSGLKIVEVIKKSCPNEIDSLSRKGASLMEQHEHEAARPWFELCLSQDKNNPAGNYYLGIIKRDRGVNTVLLLRHVLYRNAQKHFERVNAQDSTYKDVFYQYGLLEKYRENCFKAIDLVHRQLRVKDFLHHVNKELFRFYDFMLRNTSFEDAEKWLTSRQTKHDDHYLGELYSRTGHFLKADSVFHRLIADPGDYSLIPVFLSLVRMHVRKNEPEKAAEAYWKALDTVSSKLDAELFLEDFIYIVNEKEHQFLKSNLSLDFLSDAMRALWLRRNPLPSTSFNHRLIEHYRRVIYAEGHFYYDGLRNPSMRKGWLDDLKFPPWYYENYKLNDMGLIYIRFGEPDEKSTSMSGLLDVGERHNMAWLYEADGKRPRMIFHFIVPENVHPNYWTLVPGFISPGILEDMTVWDNRYHGGMPTEFVMESVKKVDTAFKMDHHSWEEEIESLELSHTVSNFRETSRRDIVQLAYAVPLSKLFDERSPSDTISFEAGVTIFDGRLEPFFKDIRHFTIQDSSDTHIWQDWFIDEFEIPLALKQYNITIHAEVPEGHKMDGFRYVYTLPDSARDRLSCSSLKLAFDIRPITDSEIRHRSGLKIIPNPAKLFKKDEPLLAYYEIYNLSYNEQTATDCTVNFVLREKKKKRNLFSRIRGVFGGKEGYQVSIENRQTGDTRIVTDYISFDMSRLKKGEYEFVLKIRDNVTGDETSTVSDFKLE